jgi:hypothetical protein
MKVRDWNIATVGRLLAVAIIVVGVALSAWDAGAVSANTGIPHYKLRSFFSESLQYIWLGGLLLAIAEIAGGLGTMPEDGRIDWRVPTLLRVLGLTVIAGGIGLAVWNGRSVAIGFTLYSPSSAYSGSKRAVARNALEFAWRGGLLIVAAELADRLGWAGQSEDKAPIVQEPALSSPPADQPA